MGTDSKTDAEHGSGREIFPGFFDHELREMHEIMADRIPAPPAPVEQREIDAWQDIAEPGIRVDAVAFAGFDEGVKAIGVLDCVRMADKEPVFLSKL